MPDKPPTPPPGPVPHGAGIGRTIATLLRSGLALRREIPTWQTVAFALLCIAVCFGLWWFVTRDRGDGDRIISQLTLPSPAETFADFPSLWNDRYLTVNTVIT